MMLWSTHAYMECRNPVTVNDCFGLPKPYMECGNLVTINALWSPIPYMDGRDLITINDL